MPEGFDFGSLHSFSNSRIGKVIYPARLHVAWGIKESEGEHSLITPQRNLGFSKTLRPMCARHPFHIQWWTQP